MSRFMDAVVLVLAEEGSETAANAAARVGPRKRVQVQADPLKPQTPPAAPASESENRFLQSVERALGEGEGPISDICKCGLPRSAHDSPDLPTCPNARVKADRRILRPGTGKPPFYRPPSRRKEARDAYGRDAAQAREVANELEEIKGELEDLLGKADHALSGLGYDDMAYKRAKAYWLTHIPDCLEGRGIMTTMQNTIDELYKGEEEE